MHVPARGPYDDSGSPERPLPLPPSRPPRQRKSAVREYAQSIVLAVVLALLFRTFVVQAFTIPSGSMMDTLLVGDYILVVKLVFGAPVPFTDWRLPGIRAPERGDVVVFRYPHDEHRDFIKRVIGLPGDVVQVRGRSVFVNGRALAEPYALFLAPPPPPGAACSYQFACQPTRVPADSYFVMGDNRDHSADSRYWGFVKAKEVEGQALVVYWSWDSKRHLVRWWRLGRPIL